MRYAALPEAPPLAPGRIGCATPRARQRGGGMLQQQIIDPSKARRTSTPQSGMLRFDSRSPHVFAMFLLLCLSAGAQPPVVLIPTIFPSRFWRSMLFPRLMSYPDFAHSDIVKTGGAIESVLETDIYYSYAQHSRASADKIVRVMFTTLKRRYKALQQHSLPPEGAGTRSRNSYTQQLPVTSRWRSERSARHISPVRPRQQCLRP